MDSMVYKTFTPSPRNSRRNNKENVVLRRISATTIKKKNKNVNQRINKKDIISSILSADKMLSCKKMTPQSKGIDAANLNKTVEQIMEDHGISIKSPQKESQYKDDHCNIFCSVSTPKPVNNVRDCIDRLFEGADDYAAFSVSKTLGISTPILSRKKFSEIDSSIKLTPVIDTPVYNKSILTDKNFTQNINSSLEDSNCFRYLPFDNISSYSFNCKVQSVENEILRTPFNDCSNRLIDPQPLSGIRMLEKCSPVLKTSNFRHISPSTLNSPTTPHTSNPNRSSIVPPISPVNEIPPEVKKKLLSGVISFVDVRTNNENCSKSVALELLSMGANVEKTLNKKVTHVIFKEGRPSTYMKGKKQGVFIVSVLWIEACKKAGKVVDPKMYPPANVEELEALSPTGIKLPSLKTIQMKLRKHLLRDAGLLHNEKSLRSKLNLRNAVTDVKDRLSENASIGRHCTKKLNFTSEKTVSKENIEVINISSDTSTLDNNKIDDSFELPSVVESRRKSAPGRLIFSTKLKRKRKDDRLPPNKEKKLLTIDQMFAKQICGQNTKMTVNTPLRGKENVPPPLEGNCNSKRKRLFNPDDSPIVIQSSFEEPVAVVNPYYEEKKEVCKTSSSKKRVKNVTTKSKNSKKSLTTLLEQEENLSCSRRSSISLFVDPKKSERKSGKEPKHIVCTSLTPEEIQKISYITGKLGTFDLEDKVTSNTSHVVTPAPRRTLNLLKGIARGCWILHVDWVYKSEVAGTWLNEADFEMKSFSPAVVECRRERQAFGPQFCLELFSSCGPIYISRNTSPPHEDLTELVRLCKGKVVTHAKAAKIIVGGKIKSNENFNRVKEKWILDCISQNHLLDIQKYKVNTN